MNIERFLEILKEEGYVVDEQIVNKYGTNEKAYAVGTSDMRVRPLIYERDILATEERNAKRFIEAISEARLGINVDEMLNKDYVLKHVVFAVRPMTEDDSIYKMITKNDLELYFRVILANTGDDTASYKVKPEMLKTLNISEDELYDAAMANTKESADIISMNELLESLGYYLPEEAKNATPMYVLSNKKRTHGAGVIECVDVLNDFCKEHEYKGVVIIPSSVHEVILLPITMEMSENEINSMIKEVNANEVAPEDVLGTHVYYHYVK